MRHWGQIIIPTLPLTRHTTLCLLDWILSSVKLRDINNDSTESKMPWMCLNNHRWNEMMTMTLNNIAFGWRKINSYINKIIFKVWMDLCQFIVEVPLYWFMLEMFPNEKYLKKIFLKVYFLYFAYKILIKS